MSFLPHEAKGLLELFCLQTIICAWRQNSSNSAFASWGKIKTHGFTWADQDWIGFNLFGSGLDSDWKISQSAHLCCTTGRRAGKAALQDGPVVCTSRRAGGLHSKLGCEKGRPKDCPFLQPAQPLPQPAGPPFCAARRPALLCNPPKVHVFHLETRPSSPPGPPALQLVLSNHM